MPTKKKTQSKNKINTTTWQTDPTKIKIIPSQKEINYAKKVTGLINESPCSFLTVKNQCKILKENGYKKLEESKCWNVTPGGKYFITRNESAIIAFQVPNKKEYNGFMMVNSHCDFPALKIKHNPEKNIENKYTTINIEIYGGPIYYSWFDCPLGVAGRAYVNTASGVKSVSVNINRPLMMIPSLAVHQNRGVNKGFDINPQLDMMPLFGGPGCGKLIDVVFKEIKVKTKDIIETELFAYRCEEPKFWGANSEYVSSRAIDDQSCAFGSLLGFLEAKPKNIIPVHMVFDNEEVGSSTRQGAASSFLSDVLSRVADCLKIDKQKYHSMLTNSMALSCDNGHALHPNRLEKIDLTNRPYAGGGALLKYSAAFNYTSDGTSAALIKKIAMKHGVQLQEFYNRSDVTAGAALGRFLVGNIAIKSADIGLAQLAMHSSYETCAVRDLHEYKELMKIFFSSEIKTVKDGVYDIK